MLVEINGMVMIFKWTHSVTINHTIILYDLAGTEFEYPMSEVKVLTRVPGATISELMDSIRDLEEE